MHEVLNRGRDAALIALVDRPPVLPKTADVEGILIEGVHGPGAQIALLLP